MSDIDKNRARLIYIWWLIGCAGLHSVYLFSLRFGYTSGRRICMNRYGRAPRGLFVWCGVPVYRYTTQCSERRPSIYIFELPIVR